MTQSGSQEPPYQLLQIKHTTIILGLLILMVVGDGLNVFLMRTGQPFWRVSIVIRALAESYFLILIVNKRRSTYVFGLLVGMLTFWLWGVLMNDQIDTYNWFENLNMVIKMVFFFICWEIVRRYFTKEYDQVRLFSLFEKLVMLQVILIFVGFVFHIDILSSYGQDYRFGYKGLLPARNEVSGFFIIAFFYYLLKLYCTRHGIVELIIILLAAFLTGAKAILVLPLALVFYLIHLFVRRPMSKIFYLIVGVSILLVGIAFWQKNNILERLSPTLHYFSYQLESGNNPTLFSAFTSGRSEYVKTLLSGLGPEQIIFGGHDMAVSSTETDLLDVFLFVGMAGTLLFYLFYIRVLFYNIRRQLGFVQILFVLTWLGVSTFSGHLVFSAINSPYLAILLLAFSTMSETMFIPSLIKLPKLALKLHSFETFPRKTES